MSFWTGFIQVSTLLVFFLVQKQYLQKSDCCLILQFTNQNFFQAIGTRSPLQMEHPNLQFATIVQWQGSVSAVLIAHCSSKPLVLLQLAKKNRMFCCSQSDPAVNKPAFFSQCCCPQFSAKCHWKMTKWSEARCFTSDLQLDEQRRGSTRLLQITYVVKRKSQSQKTCCRLQGAKKWDKHKRAASVQ